MGQLAQIAHLAVAALLTITALSGIPARAQPPTPLSQAEIREIQERLNTLGYDLTADGVAGQQTRNAIRGFARAAGIQSDGTPSANVLATLRDRTVSTSSSSALPGQPVKSAASQPLQDAVWVQKYKSAFELFMAKKFPDSCVMFAEGLAEEVKFKTNSSFDFVWSRETYKNLDSQALLFYLKSYMEAKKVSKPFDGWPWMAGFRSGCLLAERVLDDPDVIASNVRSEFLSVARSTSNYCRAYFEANKNKPRERSGTLRTPDDTYESIYKFQNFYSGPEWLWAVNYVSCKPIE